jgi:hypothetical protein
VPEEVKAHGEESYSNVGSGKITGRGTDSLSFFATVASGDMLRDMSRA